MRGKCQQRNPEVQLASLYQRRATLLLLIQALQRYQQARIRSRCEAGAGV